MDVITVVPARQDGRVVIWERDARQPDGEVLIHAGSGPTRVAVTPAIAAALAEGRLAVVPEVAAREVPAAVPVAAAAREAEVARQPAGKPARRTSK